MPRLAAIYTRISRDQDGRQSSTARQERLCRKWVREQGWETVRVFEDVGRSAYAPGITRTAYEDLLKDVTDHRFDVVVCWRLDRLVRSPGDFERFWSACQQAGVRIASATEPVDSETSTGVALIRLLVTFGGLESDAKSSRLRARNRDAAERGIPSPGPPPYGLAPGCQEIVEHEAVLIREAAIRVLDGEGCKLIARDWAARGVLNRHGRPWSPSGLRNLLEKRAICGDRTYKGEVVAEGCWPAIVDPITAAKVRLRLVGMSSKLNSVRADHLLRGLLRCGFCAEKLTARREPSRQYFNCQHCRRITITADLTEEWITDRVLRRIEARQAGNHRVRWRRKSAAAAVEALGPRTVALRELNSAHFVKGLISHPEWLRARDALLLECHQELARAAPQPRPRGLPPRVPLWKARSVWPELSVAARREILNVEMAWVIVHPGDGSMWSSERLEFVWVQPDPIEESRSRRVRRSPPSLWDYTSEGTWRPSSAVLSVAALRERGKPLTLVEACRLTGRSASGVGNARRRGLLEGDLVQGKWTYRIDALDRWQKGPLSRRVRGRPVVVPSLAEIRERGGPVTISEACELTARDETTINRARQRGQLDGEFLEGHWHYEIANLDRWQQENNRSADLAPTPKSDTLVMETEAARLLDLETFHSNVDAGRLIPRRVSNEGRWFSLNQVRFLALEAGQHESR